MTTATVTELVRNANPLGQRVELARYSVPEGQRILYGQRVDGVVRFLLGKRDVLVVSACRSEDSRCRPRKAPPEVANDVGERRAAAGIQSADRPAVRVRRFSTNHNRREGS